MEITGTSMEQWTKKWDAFTAVRWGDAILVWANRVMTAARYESAEARVEKAGHYALIVAAGLGLIYGSWAPLNGINYHRH